MRGLKNEKETVFLPEKKFLPLKVDKKGIPSLDGGRVEFLRQRKGWFCLTLKVWIGKKKRSVSVKDCKNLVVFLES